MPRRLKRTHICEKIGRWRSLYTLEVTLTGHSVRAPLTVNMVLDTGAADVGLPTSVFNFLKLPVTATESRTGASGSYTSRISTIDVTVDGRIFVPAVRVATIANIDEEFGGLLGLSFLQNVGMFFDFRTSVTLPSKRNIPHLLKFHCDIENYIDD